MVEVNCKVEKVIFHNEVNGYTVMSVSCGTQKSAFSVVCRGMINPKEGTTYLFKGEWKSGKYGVQLECEEYEEVLPSEVDDIEKYLASGLVKGIGPAFAHKIVTALGKDTFQILDSKSDEIFKIKGIGKKRVESIWKYWGEHRYLRTLVSFLKDYGITTNFIVKIYHLYGEDSIEVIKENPYRLVDDIEGFGFTKADQLALHLGYERTGLERCMAGVKYILFEKAESGNVFYREKPLIEETSVLLEVDNEYIENALSYMIDYGKVVKEDDCIYLPHLYSCEVNVADKLTSMIYYDAKKIDFDIDDIERQTNTEYDDIQREGLITALTSGVSVITGGPGTGKTTILLGAIKAMQQNHLTIAAAAPTGKAAKRMKEITGLDAKTIHRLLSYEPDAGYKFNAENMLSYDVIIIDEVSMVNIMLMNFLLLAIPYTTRLILVGDVDQLPAIGPGNVLRDIINSKIIPVVKLTKIYRQAENSDIVVNAHKVNNGIVPTIKNNKPNTDFFFIKETNYDSILRMIPELVTTRLPSRYEINPLDIQVLSPMKKNEIGSLNLNVILQEKINPTGPCIKYGSTVFRLNDKVMQIKNNYQKGIFNGETGKVIEVNEEMKEMVVDFDGNIIRYENGDFDEIVLSYATTIHKSQGSEYPIVVIPIVRGHYNMMQRNLIYTAITRAKKVCVMIGDVDMLRYAVGNATIKRRNTKLRERLSASPMKL